MEVLRDLRPLGRLTLLVAALALASAPADAQRRRNEPPPATGPQWPVKTREHVDLWLHGLALLQEDTARVPLFAKGYAERLTILKNSRGVYTALDREREALTKLGGERGHLLNAQFLPLYFGSWDEMRQAFDYFFKAEGDPRKASNREVAGIIAFLAQNFPRPDDRKWAQQYVEALQDEYAQFYKEYWLAEFRARGPALAAVDSLWQGTWRPQLQRYLNHTQQASGDLLLVMSLAGEGRSLPAGKNANQYAVTFPATPDSAETVLFTFAHEAAGAIARVAVDDHLTPAQKRQGLDATYQGVGLVRGGALIVERIFPGMGQRYAQWYLSLIGDTATEGTALERLAAAFPMPEEMIASMQRQIELSFGGI